MAILPLDLARQLKEAGLKWQPALHDEFAIPDRGLDDRTFVVTDMLSTIQSVQGKQVVSFHGSLEWALDSLVTSEVVWVPSEGQLRELVAARLVAEGGNAGLKLIQDGISFCCKFSSSGGQISVKGTSAAEAYARALLFLMKLE